MREGKILYAYTSETLCNKTSLKKLQSTESDGIHSAGWIIKQAVCVCIKQAFINYACISAWSSLKKILLLSLALH